MLRKTLVGLLSISLLFMNLSCVNDDTHKMLPPPEKVPAETTLFENAMYLFYGQHSVNKLDYQGAMNLLKLVSEGTASNSYGVALYHLGEIHELGLGKNEVDYDKAQHFYREANTKLKSIDGEFKNYALMTLGKMAQYGRGRLHNISEAIDFFVSAINLGNHEAKFLLAKLYLENPQLEVDKEQVKGLLTSAMSNGYPEAYYLMSNYFPSEKSRDFMQESAKRYYPPAVIIEGQRTNNKLAIHGANEVAMSMGLGEAFYNLGKASSNNLEQVYLMKQASLRGNLDALKFLANYYENNKVWIKSIVYNILIANKMQQRDKLELSRLDHICGLNTLLEILWRDKACGELNLLDSNIDFFINSFQNKSDSLREDYQKYLTENSRKAFYNCDWYYIYKNNLPMYLAGDLFRTYRNTLEPNSDFLSYYFAYAIAAGYAGQGELQHLALQKISDSNFNDKEKLALKLLNINSLFLMGKDSRAFALLRGIKFDNIPKSFAVDFINGNALSILEKRAEIAKEWGVELNDFVDYKPVKKQKFYDFETDKDIEGFVLIDEPKIN